MRLLPLPNGTVRVRFEADEAQLLNQLTDQLTDLLHSYSTTDLDPDPLFASLEIGGSSVAPLDPALSRLFPDAHADEGAASEFRRVTEQGLLNRKLQDSAVVLKGLGLPSSPDLGVDFVDIETVEPVEVMISPADFAAWVRTLTALRLAIAARIGLVHAEDHDRLVENDETQGTVLVFDWIAAILESLLSMEPQVESASNPDSSSRPGSGSGPAS